MSRDLITVLGEEGTFSDQISELSAFLSRTKAKGDQDAFITLWKTKATEADDDNEKKKAVISDFVSNLTWIGEATDRELEGLYNLVSSFVATYFSDKEAESLLKQLCTIVTKESGTQTQASERTIVRYRILTNIFNSLPASSPNRYLMFTALLDLAAANDELELLTDALTALPSWLAVWDIPATQKSQLLGLVASAFESADQGLRAYQFHLAHLRFLSISSPSGAGSSSAEAKSIAEKTIVTALGLPKMFDYEELFEVEAIKQVQSLPIGELLDVFVKGNIAQWESWKSANGAEIERHGLSANQLDRKIRLLELAALCSRSVSSEVPYSEIAKALNVSEDDVEVWVIDVIRAGLVSGKLSQVKQSLRVYRSAYRSFGQEQWETLEKRLTQWESSIAAILNTIEESKGSNSARSLPQNVGIPGADTASVNQVTAS